MYYIIKIIIPTICGQARKNSGLPKATEPVPDVARPAEAREISWDSLTRCVLSADHPLLLVLFFSSSAAPTRVTIVRLDSPNCSAGGDSPVVFLTCVRNSL